MFLSFVDPLLVCRHLRDQAVTPTEVCRLLAHRAIPAGTPVFLDDESMRPVEPLCSWFRNLSYDNKDAKTLREYAYIARQFVHFLQARGQGLLVVTESSWDIRHMTLVQYQYFRDVGLGGQLPDSSVNVHFRGQGAAAKSQCRGSGAVHRMRPEEWSTVLLPELGAGWRRPGEGVEFRVQECAKYGRGRDIFVPSGAVDSVEKFLLVERPELVAASAKTLGRRRSELFVVDRVDHETGSLRGVLDGQRRTFAMSAMGPELRRITVRETDGGLESLAVFIGCGGQMLGASAWFRIRCDAWARMRAHAGDASRR